MSFWKRCRHEWTSCALIQFRACKRCGKVQKNELPWSQGARTAAADEWAQSVPIPESIPQGADTA